MSEKKTSSYDAASGVSGIGSPSIQQVPPREKNAARGDALSTPVLFVETLSLDNLLERTELDIEAEFWPSAVSYADRALALDPSSARAYMYKLFADLKVTGTEQLKKQKQPFSDNPNYLKVMQLGDEKLKAPLMEANQYICDHLNELYGSELDQVRHALTYAGVVSDLGEAERLLEHIPAFPAADRLREECARKKQELFSATFAKAENCARESKWAEAVSLLESVSHDEKSRVRLLEYRRKLETENKYLEGVAFQENNQFREAAGIFAELENYKDSSLRFKKCNRMIRGNKVRAIGKEHTKAAWVNVLLSAFMALCCAICAPSSVLLSMLWGIPLAVFSIVMTVIRARYKPAKHMWIVMGIVSGLFVLLTALNVLPLGPAETALPSVICLALMLGSIFG